MYAGSFSPGEYKKVTEKIGYISPSDAFLPPTEATSSMAISLKKRMYRWRGVTLLPRDARHALREDRG